MTMTSSWYHCSVKVISRGNGRTAIAAAAYRAGAKLRDRQTEQVHDYTRRSGVIETFIVAPEHAPGWSHNLADLWNAAQEADHRKNSTMAREVELALPSSLDGTDREALAREFARHLVERYGVAVSVALHEPSHHGDDRNYHAHMLMTTRRMDESGLGAKTRELDGGRQEVKHIREYASTLINQYLENAGLDERVDHRSFADRGIAQEPTKHLGPEAAAMERRGEESRIGDENREIAEHNRQIDKLVGELAHLDAEIAAEMESVFLPSGQDDQDRQVTEMQANQAERSGLSWEEQKAVAQSAFKEFEQEFQGIETHTDQAGQSALSWEEQKQEAQRVFKDEDRQEEAIQIDQAGPLALSWEEQKRVAQSAFKEFGQEIQAVAAHTNQEERSGLSWEEQKREAQSVFKERDQDHQAAEVQTDQAGQSIQTWDEQKRAAQSAFNSPIVEYYSRAIQEKGRISEYGLGKSWYDRTVVFFENVYYNTVDYLKSSYQKLVDQISTTQDRDIDLEDR